MDVSLLVTLFRIEGENWICKFFLDDMNGCHNNLPLHMMKCQNRCWNLFLATSDHLFQDQRHPGGVQLKYA